MARQTGKNGALYICANTGSPASFAWVGDLYDWVVEVRTITFPVSIKGDTFDRREASHGEGRLTARRFVQTISVLAPLAALAIPTLDVSTKAFTLGYRVNWAVMGVDSGFPTGGDPANFDTSLFSAQGAGYVDRGHMGAPRDRLEDDFEMIIDRLVSMH